MINQNELTRSIRFALLAGISTLAIPAFAQDADNENIEELGSVVVTGSKIRRSADTETLQPIFTLNREAIKKTGLSNIGDVLSQMVYADNSAVTTVNNNTNANDGTIEVSLRNLGSDRTLVLVNGRRWVSSLDGVVDLQTIPLSIVESIEVLKDGASAIYGADAVAGVINIITKASYDGMEANTYLGVTDEGDGEIQSYDFTIGGSSERASIVSSFAFSQQESIFAGDREISKLPQFGVPVAFGSGSGQFGSFSVPGIAGRRALIPGSSGRAPTDFRAFTDADRYNFAPANYLQQPFERFSSYVQARFELTDNVTFFGNSTYVKRRGNQQIAEVPLTIGVNRANGPQWAFPVSGQGVFNPFRVDLPAANYRMTSLGPRTSAFDYDTWAFTSGVEGQFDFAERAVYWDVAYQYLDQQNDSSGDNYVNLFNLRQALGPSFRDAANVLRCGTATAVIANCVPYNIFGGPDNGVRAGVISQAELDAGNEYVGYSLRENSGVRVNNYVANVSVDLAELPAGVLAMAAGYEYRATNGKFNPDSLVAEGGSSTNFNLPTQGEVKSSEFFVEFNIPLLADVQFAKSLELNIASRFSDTEGTGTAIGISSNGDVSRSIVDKDFGSDTNSRIGLSWKPIDDLLLRANYAQTFRAPSVLDLYDGLGEGFPQALDPCSTRTGGFATLNATQIARCRAQGVTGATGATQPNAQIRSLSGGNAQLDPESGTNKTLGFVYSPSWLEGANISVDWYRIELDDAIIAFTAGEVLDRCIREGETAFCPSIQRITGGEIAQVLTAQVNASELVVEGFDLGGSYAFDTDSFGAYRFNFNSTYQIENYNRIRQADGSLTDIDNDVGELVADIANNRIKATFASTWAMSDFDFTWTMRFNSRLDEDCGTAFFLEAGLANVELCETYGRDADGLQNPDVAINRIGSHTYHDIQGSWAAPWEGKITAGIRNVGDKDPTVTTNTFANSFAQGYDIPGRFFYLQYGQKF